MRLRAGIHSKHLGHFNSLSERYGGVCSRRTGNHGSKRNGFTPGLTIRHTLTRDSVSGVALRIDPQSAFGNLSFAN
jgi:hypothetical protein